MSRVSPRSWPASADRGLAIGLATTILGVLMLLANPVAGAGPLPDPSLPIAVPSLPLPSVSLPTPTLPITLPTPTLPLPTPTLPLPTPTLPLPTLPLPTPTSSPVSPLPTAPTPSVGPAIPPAPSGLPSPQPPIVAGPVESPSRSSEGDSTPLAGQHSFLDALVLPGLVIGIPATIVILILGTQITAGAVWLPIVRRWRNRRV